MIRRPPGGATVLALAGWLLAVVMGPIALPSAVTAAVAAAPSQALTVVTNARYDIQPTHKRVHVTVDLQIANHRTDTVIRSYFYDQVVLGFLPGASAFTAVAPAGSTVHPTVRVTSRTAARVLVSVGFGTKLRGGHTLGLKLTFDLVDPGGAADRPVRVGSAVATFPVWAVGTPGTPGSKVRVTAPAGYTFEVLGSPMAGPTPGPGGTTMVASATLSAPAAFAAYVLADQPGAYRETRLTVTVAGDPYTLAVRAWQDDAAFGTRTAAILRRALPPLGTAIGIAPISTGTDGGPFAVEEAVTRSAGGYAALFDAGTGSIRIAYDAAPAVVLHEAAHVWFNGKLVADRWAAEGFASWYAAQVAGPLKIAVPSLTITKAIQAHQIPLNAWSSSGTPDPAVDAYGMAASYKLAGLIAAQVGPGGLTAVWKAIAVGAMADQPVHATGTVDVDPGGASVPDWRGLLDLIQTRTGHDLSDLWRTWVVRPDEAALLDRRATVRAAYATLVAAAGDWEVPRAIRVALDRWQFDQAADLIAQAQAVLAARPALGSAAAAIGATLPAAVRTAFEGTGGPSAAAAEMTAEQAAIGRIATDLAVRPASPGPVVQLGLAGTDPDSAADAARADFASGDLVGAVRNADAAAAIWSGALDAGRNRLALAAGVLAIFAALVLLVTAGRDRRSRARWSYRAGQVIRTVAPGPLPGVGPRSGAAWGGTDGRGPATDEHADRGGRARPARGPSTASGAGARSRGGRGPAPATATGPERAPGVHVTVRQAEHVSAALSPMAHPIDGGPRVPGAPPPALGWRTIRRSRGTVAPSGGYGTLAADPPVDRSAGPPPGGQPSDGRPDVGPRPGDVPSEPAPGEH